MGVKITSHSSIFDNFEEGKAASLDGDIIKARKLLKPIATAKPYHPSAYFLCLAEYKYGKLENCEAYCHTFLSRNDKHPGMRTISALLLMSKGNLTQAKKNLDIALSANPQHRGAMRAYSELKLLLRKEKARKVITRLTHKSPRNLGGLGRLKRAEQLKKLLPAEKWEEDAIEATIAYFHFNADTAHALENYVPELIENAVELGYCTWPRKIQELIRGRSVLDVGCGFGGYAIGYLCAGAKSYTGIDPAMELDATKMRNKRLRSWVPVEKSARQIMELVPAIKLHQCSTRELIGERTFDVVCLHNVTEHLLQIEAVFEDVSKLLSKNGKLIFMHHNFYGWSGHHMPPHTPALLDVNNPEHLRYCDWRHINIMDQLPPDHYFYTNLNRIRLQALKELTEKHFEIEVWEKKHSPKQVLDRLTPEIVARVGEAAPDVSEEELKTNAVFCVARA